MFRNPRASKWVDLSSSILLCCLNLYTTVRASVIYLVVAQGRRDLEHLTCHILSTYVSSVAIVVILHLTLFAQTLASGQTHFPSLNV
jgi:hypothetical protein